MLLLAQFWDTKPRRTTLKLGEEDSEGARRGEGVGGELGGLGTKGREEGQCCVPVIQMG